MRPTLYVDYALLTVVDVTTYPKQLDSCWRAVTNIVQWGSDKTNTQVWRGSEVRLSCLLPVCRWHCTRLTASVRCLDPPVSFDDGERLLDLDDCATEEGMSAERQKSLHGRKKELIAR